MEYMKYGGLFNLNVKFCMHVISNFTYLEECNLVRSDYVHKVIIYSIPLPNYKT